MEIKQYHVDGCYPGGDDILEIRCSRQAGDRTVMMEREGDERMSSPLAIVYNMGVDFDMRTPTDRMDRVRGMLKMIRVAIQEVAGQIGKGVVA